MRLQRELTALTSPSAPQKRLPSRRGHGSSDSAPRAYRREPAVCWQQDGAIPRSFLEAPRLKVLQGRQYFWLHHFHASRSPTSRAVKRNPCSKSLLLALKKGRCSWREWRRTYRLASG